MSQYRAVEEKVPTGINRVPHSWAVSSGWVDPQPVPLGGAEEFIWILCPDNSQSFVFICKCWMPVRLGGIPPPSGRARERGLESLIWMQLSWRTSAHKKLTSYTWAMTHVSLIVQVNLEWVQLKCTVKMWASLCYLTKNVLDVVSKIEHCRFVSTFIQFNTVQTWDIECSNW